MRSSIWKRPRYRTAASDVAEVLDRLCGLETEYALRIVGSDPANVPSRQRLFGALIAALGRRIPAVPARHFKEGIFLATGGAVWFEVERPAAGGGLIEGATPECHGVRQLLACQRAQDRLLSEAAAQADVPVGLSLVKNDQDAEGNAYGAQENYEARFASGWRLVAWRIGLVWLFPLALLTWVAILFSVGGTLAYFLFALACYLPIHLFAGGSRTWSTFLLGTNLVDGRAGQVQVPVWLESVLQTITRIITLPLAACLLVLLQACAFVPQRRGLLAFLVTRPLLAGAGLVDRTGAFFISDKGPTINCVSGFGGMLFERPIFALGHFFKAVYADSWFSPREYAELFSARHRLQVGMGDSNMAEVSEFLRVGTTMLVLDVIEAGALADPPRLRRPIASLRQVLADPLLRIRLDLRSRQAATALEIQRYYYHVCREYVMATSPQHVEAREILRCWDEVLTGLSELQSTGKLPESLVGKVDWVTKKWLLDGKGSHASWEEKKKVDIRYHELSSSGYFQKLIDAELASAVVSAESVERAMRTAPPRSPATTRGHYIREFAGGDEPVAANWKCVLLGHGWHAKAIRLSAHGAREQQDGKSGSAATDQNNRRTRLRPGGFELE